MASVCRSKDLLQDIALEVVQDDELSILFLAGGGYRSRRVSSYLPCPDIHPDLGMNIYRTPSSAQISSLIYQNSKTPSIKVLSVSLVM